MELESFRITDYRSINDSGEVKVGKVTSLVGRNESGKSNLLLALQTLNPATGLSDLNPVKDFPRHRRLDECKDDTAVVHTTWRFTTSEQGELAQIFPRAAGVTHANIGRNYKASARWVSFQNLKPISFSIKEVSARRRKIAPAFEAAANHLEATPQGQAKAALEQLKAALSSSDKAAEWASRANPGLAAFRKSLASVGLTIHDAEDKVLCELEELATSITSDEPMHQAARNWATKLLPVFIYVSEYPELTGHQNIAEYLNRKTANPPQATPGDANFEKMCKVAGLEPQLLHDLHSANDHETRNQLANRAGAVVTTELRRLWKDRQLKVRFSPDANHLDTFISDPNSIYDVEVNLDERSRGLKWFFSFYITFSADTRGGAAEKAILLLDEPGLYLHALSQGDLLRHLGADFKNQIIYTTHSPFMVPTENLDAIRTVNIDQELGTSVSNSPTGDTRTLFPLQAALGFSLTHDLSPENSSSFR